MKTKKFAMHLDETPTHKNTLAIQFDCMKKITIFTEIFSSQGSKR